MFLWDLSRLHPCLKVKYFQLVADIGERFRYGVASQQHASNDIPLTPGRLKHVTNRCRLLPKLWKHRSMCSLLMTVTPYVDC